MEDCLTNDLSKSLHCRILSKSDWSNCVYFFLATPWSLELLFKAVEIRCLEILGGSQQTRDFVVDNYSLLTKHDTHVQMCVMFQ